MWFFQEGPDAAKHKTWVHPVATFLFHYAVVGTSVPFLHDALVGAVYGPGGLRCTVPPETEELRKRVAMVLAAYFALYFCVRLALRRKEKAYRFYSEFYGITFTCSVTIPMSALGFYTNRPLVAQAFCLAAGIDQLLWYVDIAGFLVVGTFPIGVCKYLFAPGTNWINRMTSTHHLWTIPLVLWVSGGALHPVALPLSFCVVGTSALVSFCLTPVAIRAPHGDSDPDIYLNVNLSHEMWADVQWDIFRIGEERIPYLLRLVCWWSITNAIAFVVLFGISWPFAGGAAPSLC